MGLNDGTADGKSHAHAAGLRGVEMLKDPSYCVLVETYPRVFDRCLHLAGINVPRGDNQFSCPLDYAAHSFDGVHHQIKHHLLRVIMLKVPA